MLLKSMYLDDKRAASELANWKARGSSGASAAGSSPRKRSATPAATTSLGNYRLQYELARFARDAHKSSN
jgi:hypothetical protein